MDPGRHQVGTRGFIRWVKGPPLFRPAARKDPCTPSMLPWAIILVLSAVLRRYLELHHLTFVLSFRRTAHHASRGCCSHFL